MISLIFVEKKGKDKCNGLVGQAWVIESLAFAFEKLNREDCLQEALRLYHTHPWSPDTALWYRVEIDGTVLSYDPTFNHQLWFAASASILAKYDDKIKKQVESFVNKVLLKIQTYDNGVVFHASRMGSVFNYTKEPNFGFIKECKTRLRRILQRRSLYSKSVGYHGFNLHAIAMVLENMPGTLDVNSWVIKDLSRAFSDDRFISSLNKSKFGYFYNVSGFEIAYFLKTLGYEAGVTLDWYDKQLEKTLENESHILTKHAPDKNTALARVYELVRLV
ncbi:hypothetical protein RT723_16545 [Psychrosphaera aquimarina]|uniref:Agl cluster protein AglQ n=1 Tax=Psychrosphaera aquimarina TaxID=2044854 RepID=A0ABU3R4Y8_9GAMM|nr:hypothetical protein [Psychrosphaera aquimarina]MDU0114569.1 hypothetical protein [Psychrosphaera aquimarina]